MDTLETIMSFFEIMLNTRKKRHITGGILLSMSMLFGGLTITVITIKNEENENE